MVSTFAKGEIISKKFVVVANTPGYYRCWFPELIANIILAQFKTNGNYKGKLQTKTINGKVYICLYIGSAKDLNSRIYTHLHGVFGDSTLRKTLWAILASNEIERGAEYMVNQVLDNCYFEWVYTDSEQQAVDCEKSELSQSTYCYPLNIQNNTTMPKEWINELKEMRNHIHE